jgi:hypothetical protein
VTTETADVEVYFWGRREGTEEDLQCVSKSVDFVVHTSRSVDDEDDFRRNEGNVEVATYGDKAFSGVIWKSRAITAGSWYLFSLSRVLDVCRVSQLVF